MKYGAHSPLRHANEEELAMIEGLRSEVEARTEGYSEWSVLGLTTQVVAGTNFWVKIQTDRGIIHVKIFRPLPHTGNPCHVTEVNIGQTVDSPFF